MQRAFGIIDEACSLVRVLQALFFGDRYLLFGSVFICFVYVTACDLNSSFPLSSFILLCLHFFFIFTSYLLASLHFILMSIPLLDLPDFILD